MKTIRLAFLGCGFATRLHSRTLRRFADLERSYASRGLARAERFDWDSCVDETVAVYRKVAGLNGLGRSET